MEAKILAGVLALYSVNALMKFGFFFVLSYATRRKALDRAYMAKRVRRRRPMRSSWFFLLF